jgi:hypothetical protein
MTPEEELLLAILKQTIRDYLKLDPDSDKATAEFHVCEGADYKTAEAFLYHRAEFNFGTMVFNLRTLCRTLNIDEKKLKKNLANHITEY